MFTVNPVSTPTSPAQTTASSDAQSARERAISALMGSAPAVDQNALQPEEIRGVLGKNDTVEESSKDTSEATQSTSSETSTKEEPLSSQYAVLARKEKALRAKAAQQEQAFKAREAALAARESEVSNKASFDPSKFISLDDLKSNAYATLAKLGISYDDISEQAIAAQSPEAQAYSRMRSEIQEELRALREEQDRTRKQIENSQTQAYQQALKQITLEVGELVNKDPNFETVKHAGATNDVVELIERTFQEEGKLLTVEEATQAVEDYLVEEALKMSNIKKVKDRLSQANTSKQPQTVQMKTLTNSVGAHKPLSARERALLAFKGELK